MLKVVGASWYQTRISTYILIGSGLLVIGAFFIAGMERPKFDGNYCATVYWSKNYGFKIEYWKQRNDLENIPKGVARTCYKDSTHENGWSQIEIETQRTYPDWVQAFGAGLLEGSLTWNNIYYHWTNTISSACDRDDNSQNFCTWIRDLLSNNYHSIKDMLKKRSIHDHYWHQIHLYFYQLEGLENGYKNGAKRARSDLEDEIPFEDFLLMNAAADIQDLKIYFENYIMHNNNLVDNDNVEDGRNFDIPSATMVMKMNHYNNNNINNNQNSSSSSNKNNDNQNGFWKLFFGHSSAGSYSSMLRVQKRYKFHYHFTLDQKINTIPGIDITFTSYPGVLASTDDFYIIKGRQLYSLVAGVALKNENLKLWNSIDITQIIPLSVRVMTANRLSQNRRTWAKTMSRHPSTGSKQWILIDLKHMNLLNSQSIDNDISSTIEEINNSNNNKNSKGIIWIVEQLPGRFHAEDMTDNILNDSNISYWYANGTPYFNEILDASKIQINNNDDDIMKNSDIINITNLNDIEYILRKNAFRGDLLGEQSIPYGNIDMKLFSYSTDINNSHFHAIAGPLFTLYQKDNNNNLSSSSLLLNDKKHNNNNENEENDRRLIRNDIRALTIIKSKGPFKWSNIDNSISDVKHDGHPNEWNFERTSPKWTWYD